MTNDDPLNRCAAVNACREMGDEAAVPHLAPLMDDDDPEVQLSAVRALGGIGGTRAKQLLRQCAKAASDETVREAIELALVEAEAGELPLRFKPA